MEASRGVFVFRQDIVPSLLHVSEGGGEGGEATVAREVSDRESDGHGQASRKRPSLLRDFDVTREPFVRERVLFCLAFTIPPHHRRSAAADDSPQHHVVSFSVQSHC